MHIDVNFYANREKVKNCGIIFFLEAGLYGIIGLFSPFMFMYAVVWYLYGYFTYYKLSKNVLLFGLISHFIGWLTVIKESDFSIGLIVRAFVTYYLITGYLAAIKVAKDLEKNKASVNA